MLEKDPVVEDLHSDGLVALEAGRLDDAQQAFESAEAYIVSLPVTAAVLIQHARVARDAAFTHLRITLKSFQDTGRRGNKRLRQDFGHAQEMLLGSVAVTDAVLANAQLSPDNTAETKSERGATLSLLGRAATVGWVLFGTAKYLGQAREYIQRADNSLVQGRNGYYLVRNALAGATLEQAAGDSEASRAWLGRAGLYLEWAAAQEDQADFAAATKAFEERRAYLEPNNRQALESSILTRP